jgi:hypothetical protein
LYSFGETLKGWDVLVELVSEGFTLLSLSCFVGSWGYDRAELDITCAVAFVFKEGRYSLPRILFSFMSP